MIRDRKGGKRKNREKEEKKKRAGGGHMGSSCIDEYDGWRLHFHGGFPQCGADRRGGVLADDCGKKV